MQYNAKNVFCETRRNPPVTVNVCQTHKINIVKFSLSVWTKTKQNIFL